MNGRLAAERPRQSPLHQAAGEAVRLLLRDGFTLPERIGHLRDRARTRRGTRGARGLDSYCLIGWHSMVIALDGDPMVIRTTGAVAPCCILQGKELGNVYRQPVREVWHGEAYGRFRAELSRILRQRRAWTHDAERDRTVDPLCGVQGACPIGTFYYEPDTPFLRAFNGLLR